MQGKTNSKPFIEKVFTDKITITKPGKYVPTSDYVGFDEVTVDIPLINNQNLNISKNGTYTFDENYTGLGTVNVNVNKYGATIDNFLGDVDENGVLSAPSDAFDIDFTGVKEIGENALKQAFENKTINSLNVSDIEVIGSYGMQSAFNKSIINQDVLTFDKLEKVLGYNSMNQCFNSSYISLSIYFPKLKQIIPNNDVVPYQTFYMCFTTSKESNVYFTELETVIGRQIFQSIGLKNSLPYLPKLKYVEQPTTSGGGALGTMITGATIFELPALEEIGTKGLEALFSNNKKIISLLLPKVHTIGEKGCRTMCEFCTAVTRMDFPSLINVANNAFGEHSSYYAFRGCTGMTEIHFRADMQETISSIIGYADKWGATNATIYFDL